MPIAQRIEVLCATLLEGQGLERWQTSRLTAAAISHAGSIEVTASISSGYQKRWSYSSTPNSEAEAVAQVKGIANAPGDLFDRGQFSGTPEEFKAFKSLLSGLKIKFLIDSTHCPTDLANSPLSIGMGRYLASQVENGVDLSPELSSWIKRFFAEAPFTYGYWAPYKRLIKLLEPKPDAVSILAVALARVDGNLLRVLNTGAVEELGQVDSQANTSISGPKTIAYLKRRGRRWLRRLARNDQATFLCFAAAMLEATDAQDSNAKIFTRWILADILYGRCAVETNHGRGVLILPSGNSLYNRRWDRFPKAWDEHIKMVSGIWNTTVNNPDIQIWAFNVLKSQRQELPLLPSAGLRLALVSPSNAVRALACEQIAANPKIILSLDSARIQVVLEFSSARQFSEVFPTLEKHAGEKPIQDAVLSFIEKHGMPEIRGGETPSTKDKRSAMLLSFSLRFLRVRFDAIETYHLARYVGQSTKFMPTGHWVDMFQSLPLKTLIDLRLHLPELPRKVVRLIDAACRVSVAKGAWDENLAATLLLSPAPDLRKLGWALLAHASDATISTVWTTLLAKAKTPNGLELLLEGLRFKGLIDRIERHTTGARLLASLVPGLPELPRDVGRLIAGAFRVSVARGACDENLATTLLLSPAPDLRKLGWSLLAKASDATISTVWTKLIANAKTSIGMEILLEGLRFKGLVDRIERHPSGSQLLTSLVATLAIADSKIAEGLLLRLAAKGDTQLTLETLGSAITSTPDETWAKQPELLQKLLSIDPALTRFLWAADDWEKVSALAEIHLATPHLASILVVVISADEIQKLSAVKADYLIQALGVASSRLYQDRGFAVSCAVSPHPSLQQFAIARLEARSLVEAIFIPLAESGMPAAIGAVDRFIGSIKDPSALTKAVITLCDSGVGVARAIGLGLIEKQPERIDLKALLVALAEHTSPDVTAVVAGIAATSNAIKQIVLDKFDNRVLRTRRTGRKAKDLVKVRLGLSQPQADNLTITQSKANEQRVQALVDMARGSSLRDRDWALQQLTTLALDGHSIPQMQISLTS